MLLLGIILTIVGLCMIIKPNLIWTICESWKSEWGSEPSNFYRFETRFGGVIFLIIGVASIVVHFIE